MAKDPAVLFYTSDFLTGTAYFTDAERGQYIRLLCEQHQNGHIPENHMVSVCFSLGSPVVKKFIQDENGLYFNERMELEILKRIKFTESRRVNGCKGGRPKNDIKANGLPNGLPNDKATENLIGNGNENVNKKAFKKEFIKPTIEQVKEYFHENGYSEEAAIKAWNYYDTANWTDSKGSKVRNWKQKMISVWFKDENRIKQSILEQIQSLHAW